MIRGKKHHTEIWTLVAESKEGKRVKLTRKLFSCLKHRFSLLKFRFGYVIARSNQDLPLSLWWLQFASWAQCSHSAVDRCSDSPRDTSFSFSAGRQDVRKE